MISFKYVSEKSPEITFKSQLSDQLTHVDFDARHVMNPTCDVASLANYWHSTSNPSTGFPMHAFTIDYKEEKVIVGFELKNSNNGRGEGDTSGNWCVHEFK